MVWPFGTAMPPVTDGPPTIKGFESKSWKPPLSTVTSWTLTTALRVEDRLTDPAVPLSVVAAMPLAPWVKAPAVLTRRPSTNTEPVSAMPPVPAERVSVLAARLLPSRVIAAAGLAPGTVALPAESVTESLTLRVEVASFVMLPPAVIVALSAPMLPVKVRSPAVVMAVGPLAARLRSVPI